ncbi:aspartate-semialdehyde dehydrogenase [Candidatus Gottesmanbacteria bacterium]|nr:aspartate-semialdehyde dehydrogenase [Candidatus Gottesmanbacteria bacterium]
MKKLRVGVLGATGMVGQKFLQLLENHLWFEVVALAASPQSAGKKYDVAVIGRWAMDTLIPKEIKKLKILAVEKDMKEIAGQVDFVFSALDMEKEEIKRIEDAYAALDVPVISNNSAHRWTGDVPMIIPEVNPEHSALIDLQRKHHGWKKGFVAVKPNCSIQCYVPLLHALKDFGLETISVSTYQAISGAGKTFKTWPEMMDNVIPFIGGEEKKSEEEPLKVWGALVGGELKIAKKPTISATCIRVPVTNGHMASVAVKFKKRPTREEILLAWKKFPNPLMKMTLPSAPKDFLHYFEEDNRPQTKLDRDINNGMTISVGRLREDPLFHWKFVALSHNTARGAAGGAILLAELLVKQQYIK